MLEVCVCVCGGGGSSPKALDYMETNLSNKLIS
jgi:hypothetical protein